MLREREIKVRKSWKIGMGLFILLIFASRNLPGIEGSLSVDVNRLSDNVAIFKIGSGDANIVGINSEKGIVMIESPGRIVNE